MGRKIKVLHIVGAMYPGGMENFIMNIYENIDRERFSFDFAVHDIKENGYEPRIKELGGKVFLLPRMTKHPIKNMTELGRHIKEEGYDVVVRHTANALVAPQLLAAKKAGAITICHSHNETDPKKIAHVLGRLLLLPNTDVRLACSENAGKWMYGDKSFEVINNAIDLNKFEYKAEKRQKVIDEFHLEGKHIYGHIANFIASKNHLFLMEIFKEIARLDEKAVFICLGEGDLKPEVMQKAKDLGIGDKVIFTGIRHDAENFMSAFDVMVFPSFFEGLPLTLIEAQVSSLPILMSDTITPNVIVTKGLVESKSIQDSAESWAEAAIQLRNDANKEDTAEGTAKSIENATDTKSPHRICQRENIREHGYDLEQLVRWYEEFLTKLVD
ncbi:glycosyltransferase [Butyrivibrio sp. VCD2006]|uniref:glycosyltransferase n=1 Tax=Butyrivibrio sp. VCD2006 TaxID=1280664 RepID=UPI0003F650A0|nr:glycosyltransferase [Butyrivibrio sp. VCD2006]